ncbi:MAG: 50S ribosome-binding GTPase, partial [Sulfobacillus sp.]|nr:50S ribosome-binding GTPase [Sulfobacillus sp.]
MLSGHYAEVSNFPGTTVELLSAPLGPDRLWDTPGIYGLSRLTEEERVALDAIRQADLVINVVDGTHLARDAFLTWHLIDAGLPVIVAVNFHDELIRRGMTVDIAGLSRFWDVPVVLMSARTGDGVEELKRAIRKGGRVSSQASQAVPTLPGRSRLESLLWLEEDSEMVRALGRSPAPGSRQAQYIERRMRADQAGQWVTTADHRADPTRRFGYWLMTPLGGGLTLVIVLALVYWGLGVGVADWLVGHLENWANALVIPLLATLVGRLVPPGSWLYRLLVGQYGILSAGVLYLGALLLPLIAGFYFMLAVLEDSGYLPRLATLLDRFFLRLGLNGRAVIPLVLGFGCVTMATMTTRILTTERERRIATILLAWTIPCSAQMGVIIGLLSGVGWIYALTYALIILGLFIGIGTALDRTLPGRPSPLLLELPPLRWPSWTGLWEKTRWKVGAFLKEAGPLFLIGSGSVELLDMLGVLPWLNRALAPFMEGWLGIPGSATAAFLLGFIRRDFGAVGLYAGGLDPHQVLTGAVTLTLFVPCIASTLVILKERGLRQGSVIWLGSIALALLVGGLVARWGPG